MSTTLKSSIPQLIGAVKAKAKQFINQTAMDVETGAKTSMTETKSGRKYGSHQASAPGEAPAIDSKELVQSFGIEATGETSVAVGVMAKHGVYMEFGTSKIAPRPFLMPAFEDAKDDFEKGLKELVR